MEEKDDLKMNENIEKNKTKIIIIECISLIIIHK